ncbi:hypothetical protein GGI21_001443 [Coemansia aciculifera]|nr:hypothetical protein GGI21_001443 [Coemansia aciculifera]
MKLILSLAVTSCLLALSNATMIGISGDAPSNLFYNIDDYECHSIPTMNTTPNGIQVQVTQGPVYGGAAFYSSSDCSGSGLIVFNNDGPWQYATGPISSFRLVKPAPSPLPAPATTTPIV